MSSLEIYRETIWWRLIILLIAVVDIPLIASIWLVSSVSPPDDPLELPLLIALLVIVSLIVIAFSRFTVVLTNSGIAVGFGVSKGRFKWDEVEDCYPDQASALRYGGFGIKGGIYEGRKRLVYNVTGAKRVVLKVRGRKYDEFVFSARNPEQVMRLIRMQIGRQAS